MALRPFVNCCQQLDRSQNELGDIIHHFFTVCSFARCKVLIFDENITECLKKKFREIIGKQNQKTNGSTKSLGFEGATIRLVMNADKEQLKLRNGGRTSHCNHSNFAPKIYDITDGIQILKLNIATGKKLRKGKSLNTGVLNERLSGNGEKIFRQLTGKLKYINKKMLSSHQIAKRAVNTSEETQSTMTLTTDQPSPPPK